MEWCGIPPSYFAWSGVVVNELPEGRAKKWNGVEWRVSEFLALVNRWFLTVLVDEGAALCSVHVGPGQELDVPQLEHRRGHLKRGERLLRAEAQHVEGPLHKQKHNNPFI
ncbi:hypothetical protein AVEN_14210-1 [Araneus ventricosus]|uniref:Uncharacterized protein n=1 Tax=Araneus ventricosus TaxID=182803 RepID=A0A4Y2SNQ0_ARAVE|nr:hypothetical protein AVEN_270174-1 [Araneus ventricosus]GBN89496.1 hypothetical protein AVEN_14210-1 [Araneus ventricosus]